MNAKLHRFEKLYAPLWFVVLLVLCAIGSEMSRVATPKTVITPAPILSAAVKLKMHQDCATRGLQQSPRHTKIGSVDHYIGANNQPNVHGHLNDSLGNEVRDVRCVYTPDGAMFIRGD